jgi:hypothetical protein
MAASDEICYPHRDTVGKKMAKKVTPTGEVETPEKCLVPYLTSPQIRH